MSKFTDHEKVGMLLFGWEFRPQDAHAATPEPFTIEQIMDAMANRGWFINVHSRHNPNQYQVQWTHGDIKTPIQKRQFHGAELTGFMAALEAACVAALSTEEVERKDD